MGQPADQSGAWDARWRRLRSAVLGLQCKSTVAVVALTLTVAALMWWLLGQSTARLTERLQCEQCTQLAALLARTASPLMLSGDSPGLTQLVKEHATGDPILYVCITDADGRRLAASAVHNRWVERRGSPDAIRFIDNPVGVPKFRAASGSTPAYLDVVYPITGNQDGAFRRLGYIRLGLNLERTLHDLASAVELVSGVGIGAILLTIPLGFLVVRRVVLPLEDLRRVMRRFADGDLTARSSVQRDDEIGALAGAFNQMAEQHARTHAQIVALNVDLEERVQRRTRQLRELACRDPLTGLYNRRYFNEMLLRGFSESHRYDTDMSCMMIDLDDFKAINDRLGHHTGDQVLILAASTVAGHLRAADVAARYGGDEFVVLLPQTSGEQAHVLAQRIREKFAAELDERLADLAGVTLSIGIASRRDLSSSDADALLKAADRAMYATKARRKHPVAQTAAGA